MPLFLLLAAFAPAETPIHTNFSGSYQPAATSPRVSGSSSCDLFGNPLPPGQPIGKSLVYVIQERIVERGS